jgi:integrase
MSRAEADTERKKILAPLTTTAAVNTTTAVTLRDYVLKTYLIVRGRKWKASTRGTTEQIIEDHILREMGSRLVVTIPREDLQSLIDRKAESGLSASVVGHIRWQLKRIFRMAKADGLIMVNPTEELAMGLCKEPGEKRTISVDGIRRGEMVLEIRERLVFHLAVYHGMRPGEIMGLQLRDIQNGTVHVIRRIYRGIEDKPKSRKSRRPIPLMERTARLLEQWRDMLSNQNPEAWLFPSETGQTPLSYSNLYRRHLQPALRQVGLGDVNFQILRRTWVNEMSRAEKDPKVRAQLAGHSVDVEENVYRQSQPHLLKKAMKKLERKLQ